VPRKDRGRNGSSVGDASPLQRPAHHPRGPARGAWALADHCAALDPLCSRSKRRPLTRPEAAGIFRVTPPKRRTGRTPSPFKRRQAMSEPPGKRTFPGEGFRRLWEIWWGHREEGFLFRAAAHDNELTAGKNKLSAPTSIANKFPRFQGDSRLGMILQPKVSAWFSVRASA